MKIFKTRLDTTLRNIFYLPSWPCFDEGRDDHQRSLPASAQHPPPIKGVNSSVPWLELELYVALPVSVMVRHFFLRQLVTFF